MMTETPKAETLCDVVARRAANVKAKARETEARREALAKMPALHTTIVFSLYLPSPARPVAMDQDLQAKLEAALEKGITDGFPEAIQLLNLPSKNAALYVADFLHAAYLAAGYLNDPLFSKPCAENRAAVAKKVARLALELIKD